MMRAEGFDVWCAGEEAPTMTDEQLLEYANCEARIIITNDKDFGELVYLQKKVTEGILLLRFSTEKSTVKAAFVEALLKERGFCLTGHFVVLSEAGVRARKLR